MKVHAHPERLAGVRRRTGQISLVAASIAASVAVAACGSSNKTNSTAASAPASSTANTGQSSGSGSSSQVTAANAALKPYLSAPTKINITTPLKSAPPSGKTVVFLGTTNPSNVIIQQGVQKLAKLANWNYSLVSYDAANPGTFTSAITTALAKHPQYLIEAGTPPTASQLSAIQKGGAKLILDSVYPVKIASPVISQVDGAVQDALMGRIIANYFIANSGGKGDAVIEHVPAYPILDAFTNAFQAQVKAKCPACKMSVTNITIPQLTAGQTSSTLVSALRSNSSANYLVYDDGPFADGITSALSSAGLSGKVKVIGEAADVAGVAALKAGTEQAWTGFDPGYQAYENMDIMFRDAEGMTIPQNLEATQPTQLLTKQTIGSTTNWSAPANPLPQFQSIWKLK